MSLSMVCILQLSPRFAWSFMASDLLEVSLREPSHWLFDVRHDSRVSGVGVQ